MNRFRDVDWVRLYKVLVVAAARTVRHHQQSELFDSGLDHQDVAQDVLAEFYNSPDGLGWKESKGKLEAYLARIVQNRVVDHLRRQRHVAGSLDDDSRTRPATSKQQHSEAPERARSDLKEELYALVGDDPKLRDLIAAAEMTSGEHNVNQELGEILDKTPRQVSKLKERLLATKGVKELYAARQAAKSTA